MQQIEFACLGQRIEMWTHPDPDHMGMAIRANRNFYELDVLMKCREIYLPGTSIVDAGANIGNHAVFFAKILNAPVYAFEPFEANYALLALNIAVNGLDDRVAVNGLNDRIAVNGLNDRIAVNGLNDRIAVACMALGEDDGTASLSPGPATNRGMTRVTFGDGEVPVRSLDSLGIPGSVGLLKIDVEGAEVPVLFGASTLIETWLPDILIEAGDAAAFHAVTRVLTRFGYLPEGRFAATPTYLFRAVDQRLRMQRFLAAG